MNKKADVEISLKTLIGFVLVSIIFFAFIGFFVKMWGIFLNKPEQATLNSFKNLMYEINELEENEEKTVPFYIQKKLYLRSACQLQEIQKEYVLNDLCICTKDCKKRHIREALKEKVRIGIKREDGTNLNEGLTYDEDKKVRNLYIYRSDKGICIYDESKKRERECNI